MGKDITISSQRYLLNNVYLLSLLMVQDSVSKSEPAEKVKSKTKLDRKVRRVRRKKKNNAITRHRDGIMLVWS